MSSIFNNFPDNLPVSVQVAAGSIAIGLLYSLLTKERPFAALPMISLEGKSPRESYLTDGKATVLQGMRKYQGPFQIMTGTGPKIVLPNHFADEIRNHPDLNFPKAFAKDLFVDYPGFEAHRQGLTDDTLIQETVRVKLTQSLGLVTDDLVQETADSLRDILGENEDWNTVGLRDSTMDLVARLSSRVFLGKDLCRNERWLDIAKTYTVDSFVGSACLRLISPVLRPLAQWFIPSCAALRKAVKDAHKLIDPEVQRRKAIVDKALAAGQKPPKVADTIGWMHEVSRGRKVDYVAGQLALTLAAIHTTTEVTSRALMDICEHPEVVQPLREEIISVLKEDGWAKTSLYKLKLMDSFLKEGQRCSPLSIASMNRYVETNVTLSDGTKLPKGSRLVVLTNYMDPEVYPEPEKFDAARFLHMRQKPGQENAWQFVTTSPEHMLFGHGQHACPGRFFASNEVKIALCHLLLKYDWQFLPGQGRPESIEREASSTVDPRVKIQVKKRVPELDLDAL